MNITRHSRESRGAAELDWLSTRYSFSFANWYDPTRMGFGTLRVINDDRIAAASGFPPHSHRDMEIITLVTAGALQHKDSMGNEGVVRAGEVQVMSAGTGVTHSEYNASDDEPLELFQMWIIPDGEGYEPRYAQRLFDHEEREEDEQALQLLVAPLAESDKTSNAINNALGIHQNAYISLATVSAGESVSYTPHDSSGARGIYLLVIGGNMTVCGVPLRDRDALAIELGHDPVLLEVDMAGIPAKALIFEVPMELAGI